MSQAQTEVNNIELVENPCLQPRLKEIPSQMVMVTLIQLQTK